MQQHTVLRTLRKLKGMSQQDLAERVHTDQTRISKYETGVLPIPPHLFPALLLALDLPPEHMQRVYAHEVPHRLEQAVLLLQAAQVVLMQTHPTVPLLVLVLISW